MEKSNATPTAKSTSGALLRSVKGPLFILLVTVYFYVLAGKIDENPIPGQLGSAFWPKALLILLMISCVIKAVEAYRTAAKEGAVAAKGKASSTVDPLILSLMIVSVLGVVFLMDMIGFILANFLFLVFFMIITGYRRISRIILISALGTIVLLYLFVKVVYIPLPKGQFFFNDLTIFIYRILYII
jgi:putative tricarboxylic transport membrane protein